MATATAPRSTRDPGRDSGTTLHTLIFAAIIFFVAFCLASSIYGTLVALNGVQVGSASFDLRRLGEPFPVAGVEISSALVWGLIWIPTLAAGLTFVALMYRKDCQSVHWMFAVVLGLVRSSVYLLLAIAFLLPALQQWEVSNKSSRVAILIDVSGSMHVSDELPSANRPIDQLETRYDKMMRLLTDDDVRFMHRLLEKNPVVVYRFGSRLDEEYATLKKGESPWNADTWRAWGKADLKLWLLQGLSESGRQMLVDHPEFQGEQPGTTEWAINWLKKEEGDVMPAVSEATGFTAEDRQRLKENRDKLEKRMEVVRQLMLGTNVGESVLTAINREATNMLQGIVVLSDGRSNQGSESILTELRARAKRENIPIFTVAIGEDRQQISIQIVDVQTPEQAPPDERFVIRAEIDGVGLAGQDRPVFLDIYRPGDDLKTARPAHTIDAKVTFAPGEPPHGQVEFALDPTATDGKEKLPVDFFKPIRKAEPGAKEPMEPGDESQFSTGKPELLEGEWRFVVRVPKDENEAFAGTEHVSDAVSVQVIKKALRVLLFAGGPTRDFQFVRTLLVREMDQKRAEISVFVQNLGRDGRDVQDVPPERRLSRFPNTLLVGESAATLDPKEKYYNLDEYDVIMCFDPDWSELLPEQFRMLQTWVERQAGGLIIIGGPIHTFQLARAAEGDKLQTLAELFPVIPGDSVLPINPNAGLRRNTRKAWHLNFPGANRDMEFLKLDDDKDLPLAGWDDFFFRKEKRDERDTEAFRGFFNFYPVQSVKKGAQVIATFADPAGKMPDGSEHPWLVTMEYPQGRIIWLGSGEVWRLRQFKEVYFDRFWIKLARYASAGTRTRQSKRGVLVMGKQFTAGNFMRLEVQLFGPDSNPLPETAEVKAFVSPLTSDDPKDRKEVTLGAKRTSVSWGGWFQGRHLVNNAGEYKIEVPVPGTPDFLRGKFLVKESNPELDMVRPDFAALYQMASPFNEIQPRLDGPTADKVRETLIGRRVLVERGAAGDEDEVLGDGPRLYFDTRNAGLIPDCMDHATKVQRNRGAIDDLWDYGTAWVREPDGTSQVKFLASPREVSGNPKWLHLPWLLFIVVALFSMEWLTRKLLRLA